MSLSDYQQTNISWRNTLRRNQHRSYAVIATFVAIYCLLGLVIDLSLYQTSYPDASLNQLLGAMISGYLLPYATLLLGAMASMSVWITYHFASSIMLLGTEYQEVKPDDKDPQLRQLYNTVAELKVAAGLQWMPRVYIIEASYMNAFASGFNEKNALVAITRGLLEKCDRDECQAVMAHELSHIRHLDIKLTLVASVLANLLVIVVDILCRGLLLSSNNRRKQGANGLLLVILVLRFVLPIITLLLTLYLSRSREYMADAGCVQLTRQNEPLARALLKMSQDYAQHKESYQQQFKQTPHENVRRAAYIIDPNVLGVRGVQSFNDLFSTHPSLSKRLAALGFKTNS